VLDLGCAIISYWPVTTARSDDRSTISAFRDAAASF
jgi:hypothetical protein